jgi:hypothetical protein
MADPLIRLFGCSEDGRRSLLDEPCNGAHPWGVPRSGDLIAVDVHADDVGDYSVTEPGWYAVDDAGRIVLGPFDSLRQCDRAIADRKRILDAEE